MAKMAKKTTATAVKTASSKGFDFGKFDAQLSKIEGFETGSIFENNVFSEVDEWISVGNYLMNAQFSGTLFGGIPNTRSVGFGGDPGSGKTFLCLNIVREAQKTGYFVFYCDTEGAVDREQANNFGIDTSKVRYQPIKTISQFKTFVVTVIGMLKDEKKKRPDSDPPKFMIVLDSLGMLTTDKEQKDAIAGHNAQDMGSKAKELRSLFRNITLDLAEHRIPLICTNHSSWGGMMAPKTVSGGDGPIFAMSLLSMLSTKQLKEGDVKTGIIVKSSMKKSRFAIPRSIEIHISFLKGMNPFVGLEHFISWENCGVERGSVVTVKEAAKLKVDGEPFKTTVVDEETGEVKELDLVFIAKATAKTFAVRHLGKNIAPKELFTEKVFTQEVLKQLDDNAIKPYFAFPSKEEAEAQEAAQYEEVLDSDEDSGSEE
jgi:RecA/RadA recombinase